LSALQDEPLPLTHCARSLPLTHCARSLIAHADARTLQFERSRMVLMSHIREASKVTVNSSYFHPAHQHYTDEAHKAETVPSVVI
jgi:predicted transcriptional regulator